MVAFYKQFMYQYKEKDGKIIVTSIVAHGNFHCIYGERVYDSINALHKDLDDGKYGR